eukprot:GDKJ01022687.1.p1 GENE.GDKJ01022687.1~~GDKJ01022687.1.p1  ORF type:complete len:431 (+),score=72.64 GDKJ01022687.1:22-1293(+)
MKFLFVGEGDFSFTFSLLQNISQKSHDEQILKGQLHYLNLSDSSILKDISVVSSSYDSAAELNQKYPETAKYIEAMQANEKFSVLHRINAWNLKESFPDEKFDAVIWNHPHVGIEDCALHRRVLAHFIFSASEILKNDGFIQITLLSGQVMRWDSIGAARHLGWELQELSPFEEACFPWFTAKRNERAESFKNSHVKRHHVLGEGASLASHGGLGSWLIRFTRNANSQNAKKLEENFQEFFSKIPQTATSMNTETKSITISLDTDFEQFKNKKTQKYDIYKCGHCEKEFKELRGVKNHITQHENEQNFKCEECGKECPNEESLQQHKSAKHSGIFKDDDLSYSLSRKTTVRVHDADAPDPSKFDSCRICESPMINNDYDQHMESMLPTVLFDMPCDTCGKMFKEIRALRQHTIFCELKRSAKQ